MFLQEQADYHAMNSNIKSSTIIKRIIQTERIKQTYGIINYKTSNTSLQNVNQLQILQNDGSRETITEREQINKLILSQTKSLFEDINHLPITNQSITQYIGEYAQKSGANDILNNNIIEKHIPNSPYLKEYLTNLQRPKSITKELITAKFTPTEFISTFRKANEKTMASPSGVHYFHYKAATYDPKLTRLLATRLSIPFHFPFKVNHWSQSHHVLLPKTNPPLLHKMRNIQIIEADYNSYFKQKINHQLLNTPQVSHILQNQMYGGIQNRSTHLSITNQLLINDYITLTKSSAYITQYDAANCFDRMIPNLTAIALTRLGSPQQIGIQLAINSLNTTHRITSKDGLSNEKYHEQWQQLGQVLVKETA